jgi:hypothetical protein
MLKTKDLEICVDREKLIKLLKNYFIREDKLQYFIQSFSFLLTESDKEILEILRKLENNEKSPFEAILELKNIAIRLIDEGDFFNAGRVSSIIAISASGPLGEKLIEEIYKHVIEKDEKEKSLSIREK